MIKNSVTQLKKNRKNVDYFMLHIKLRLYQKKIISVKNKFVVNSIVLTRKQKVRSSQMLTFKFNKKKSILKGNDLNYEIFLNEFQFKYLS